MSAVDACKFITNFDTLQIFDIPFLGDKSADFLVFFVVFVFFPHFFDGFGLIFRIHWSIYASIIFVVMWLISVSRFALIISWLAIIVSWFDFSISWFAVRMSWGSVVFGLVGGVE